MKRLPSKTHVHVTITREPRLRRVWTGGSLLRLSFLVCGVILVGLLTAAKGFAQYPDASDVATPEAIVTAAYESIMRAPGENYNWARFRSLFIPTANLIPNAEQSGGEFLVMTPEDFIARADAGTNVGGPNDRGFAEEAVHNIVEEYGDIAHVFSHYQKHFWEDDRILGRGINTFQLVKTDGRWWIVGIVWDETTGAGPIPQRYWGQ